MSVARHSEVQFFLAEKFLDKMNFSGFFYGRPFFYSERKSATTNNRRKDGKRLSY